MAEPFEIREVMGDEDTTHVQWYVPKDILGGLQAGTDIRGRFVEVPEVGAFYFLSTTGGLDHVPVNEVEGDPDVLHVELIMDKEVVGNAIRPGDQLENFTFQGANGPVVQVIIPIT